MALIDACVRVFPGVMGKEASGVEESFSAGLLEYPHYTRPQVFEGRSIPDVLTCGDHAKVEAWRQDEAERLTRDRRPDLWAAYLTRMQTLPDQTGTRTADTHAIVMVDDRGVIQSWNAGAQALFGYPAVAAVGQTLDVIVPPKYRERHWAGFHAAIKSGKAQSENTPSKVPVLCRDGSVAAFPVRFILLRDPLGQAVGAVAIFARSGDTGA
jgi:PAS domain S-box-containing protein